MGRILDCFCKGTDSYKAFTQSHQPKEAIPYSYERTYTCRVHLTALPTLATLVLDRF